MVSTKKVLGIIIVGLFLFVVGIASFSKPPVKTEPSPKPQVEGTQTQNSPTPIASNSASLVKVKRVIDGDTIEIEDGRKIRLIGIDTPELNKSGEAGCFGREAYDYANKLLTGQTIKLEKDISETDRYGRLLRFIYLGDTFINDKLVKDGYARVYTYPPDVKYQDKFKESESYARDNNLGLWSKCNATVIHNTVAPTVKATSTPIQNTQNSSGSFVCDCSKACTEISSCTEAQYQLKTCGCSKRDKDGDGIACDGAPLNCQN